MQVVREAEGHPWQQVVVGQRAQQGLTELRQHLTDPLIARCLGIGGWRPPPRSVWRRIADALAQAGHSFPCCVRTCGMLACICLVCWLCRCWPQFSLVGLCVACGLSAGHRCEPGSTGSSRI